MEFGRLLRGPLHHREHHLSQRRGLERLRSRARRRDLRRIHPAHDPKLSIRIEPRGYAGVRSGRNRRCHLRVLLDLFIENYNKIEGDRSDELEGACTPPRPPCGNHQLHLRRQPGEMYGGGIATDAMSMLVADCMFNGNFAGGYGDGIYSLACKDEAGHQRSVSSSAAAPHHGLAMAWAASPSSTSKPWMSNSVFEDNYGYVAGDLRRHCRARSPCPPALQQLVERLPGDVNDIGTNTEQSCWCSLRRQRRRPCGR